MKILLTLVYMRIELRDCMLLHEHGNISKVDHLILGFQVTS